MQKTALTISGLIFAIVGLGHLLRYFQGWDLIIGPISVSLGASLIAGVLICALACLNFLASRGP